MSADWYKREPRRFIDGVHGIGPELIGCYSVILDLIYVHEGSVHNDPRWIGSILGCSTKSAQAYIRRLIDLGKLSLHGDRLTNEKALTTIRERSERKLTNQKNGSSGGSRSAVSRSLKHDANLENNDLAEPIASPREEKRREERDIEPDGSIPPESPKPKKSTFVLPPDIPAEPWEGFEEMRRKIRKPMTDKARALIVNELRKLAEDGHPPGKVLEQSIMHDWQGVFRLKDRNDDRPRTAQPAGSGRSAGAAREDAFATHTARAVDAARRGELGSATVSERTEIAKHMPQLLAIASSQANPKERDAEAVDALLAPLIALPAAPTAEASGQALMAGYRIGLAKVPTKLLKLAVERALQDATRKWRPGPTELIAYVSEEMAQIRRRLNRPEHMRLYPARELPEDRGDLTPEQQEEFRLKMEGLAARLGSQSTTRSKEDEMVAKEGPAMPPTVEDYVKLGLSREAAERAVAEMKGVA